MGYYKDFAKNLPDDIEQLCILQRMQIIHPVAFRDNEIRNKKDCFWGDMTKVPVTRLEYEDDIFLTAQSVIAELLRKIYNKLTMIQLLISFLLIIISSLIFYSFSLLCMSISFYLMDGHNVSNGLYGTFSSNSLYHGGAFTGVLRFIFMFIIPSLLLGAIPVELVKNLEMNNLIMILALTIFWFGISVLFFYKSLSKYESNNFFGFGG